MIKTIEKTAKLRFIPLRRANRKRLYINVEGFSFNSSINSIL